MTKGVAILGSTGSVGRQTLEVIERFPEDYRVVALAAGSNARAMAEQVRRYRPQLAALADDAAARELGRLVAERTAGDGTTGDGETEVVGGGAGVERVATHRAADLVVAAIVGGAGLLPTYAAVKAGKRVALANKEPLVMAGELMMAVARQQGATILPVDSEHSAIFQSISGHHREEVRRVWLTASGGPFLKLDPERLQRVTPGEALRHPNWSMGSKITIDSATMMNKAFEVIEARWLFDIPADAIEILIHPESAVHSLVEYRDGSTIAQLAIPDMRVAIAYALSYPQRHHLDLPSLDLARLGRLTFLTPDRERFPACAMGHLALQRGGTAPAALNAANEVAVEAFLGGALPFPAITEIAREVLETHRPRGLNTIGDALEADAEARGRARELLAEHTAP